MVKCSCCGKPFSRDEILMLPQLPICGGTEPCDACFHKYPTGLESCPNTGQDIRRKEKETKRPKCGVVVLDGSFCTNCGTKVPVGVSLLLSIWFVPLGLFLWIKILLHWKPDSFWWLMGACVFGGLGIGAAIELPIRYYRRVFDRLYPATLMLPETVTLVTNRELLEREDLFDRSWKSWIIKKILWTMILPFISCIIGWVFLNSQFESLVPWWLLVTTGVIVSGMICLLHGLVVWGGFRAVAHKRFDRQYPPGQPLPEGDRKG